MTTRSQLGGSDGICTCEEGNLVAEPDQFFGQVRNDALSASVQPWWNAFDKRCYLCHLHDDFSMFLQKQTRHCTAVPQTTGVGSGIAEAQRVAQCGDRFTIAYGLAVSVAKLQFLKVTGT